MTSSSSAPRNALITGASQRIGRAIAIGLAKAGTHVAVHYHSSLVEAEDTVREIEDAGVKAVAIHGDLSDSQSTREIFDKAREALGTIDLLVNNASVFEPDQAQKFDTKQFDLHMAVHVKAPSILAAAMAAQKDLEDGLIVNLIDQRVWRLTPNFYTYTLSKSALWTATRTLAQALAPKIRVNAIGPGPTLPNERQRQSDFDRQVDALLLKRGPELSEFASTILHFWQARSVTGQMIALDGGQHLAWETPDVTGVRE